MAQGPKTVALARATVNYRGHFRAFFRGQRIRNPPAYPAHYEGGFEVVGPAIIMLDKIRRDERVRHLTETGAVAARAIPFRLQSRGIEAQ
jgi:hypothetical protein